MKTFLKNLYFVIARIKETKQSRWDCHTPLSGVRNDNERGQSIIEILLVIGLTAIILPAILTGVLASRDGKVQQNRRLDAVALLKEAQEAVRNVREKDWNTFAVNGTFHPEIAVDNSWSLVANAETINGFTRSVIINDVNRDASGAIVLTGGTLDPSTKKIITTVSWTTPAPSSVTSTTYIARLDNITYTETLETEFDAGTGTGVTITNTSGGEVTLGSGGQGNWCEPSATPSATLDLPKSGVANAITAIEGRAFAGTGDNASGESFVNINISDTDPPVASILGTFSNYKTNDVFGEANYGYIATDTNSKEIVIISLTTNPYSEIGSFNASGNTDANSVFVVGDTGYMTQGSRLRNFDLVNCSGGNRTGVCPALDADGAAISATGTSVVVSGSYAFVSIAGHARELEIFDISNPANIVRIGWADVNGEAATDLFVNSTATRAYIVTNASASLPEFFIIDITNKNCSDCPDIGRYNAGTSVNLKAVEVVPGNRAIIIGQGGEEYQVIDISTETSPVRCGGLEIDSGINDSASILETDGDAYSYILTGDANQELWIIEGGPGGQYSTSGDFTSQTIPIPMPVNETSFNRFEVSVNRPSQTDIQFQVAVAEAVAGSCTDATFTFVGEDGTNSDFFDTAVTSGIQAFDYAIPTAINPGQCFQYKLFLSTSDLYQTPIFYDITINYAP